MEIIIIVKVIKTIKLLRTTISSARWDRGESSIKRVVFSKYK